MKVSVSAAYTSPANLGLSKATGTTTYDAKARANGSNVDSGDEVVGTVTLTAAWQDSPTPAEKLALNSQTCTFTVTAGGNVVLLKSSSRGGTNNELSGAQTVTLTYDAANDQFIFSDEVSLVTDDGANGTSTATLYIAVQPNNDNGVEATGAATTWAANKTPAYAVGDQVKYSVDNKYYVCEEANGDAEWTPSKWSLVDNSGANEAIPHSSDAVDLA